MGLENSVKIGMLHREPGQTEAKVLALGQY